MGLAYDSTIHHWRKMSQFIIGLIAAFNAALMVLRFQRALSLVMKSLTNDRRALVSQ
jgi:hypothetical protein